MECSRLRGAGPATAGLGRVDIAAEVLGEGVYPDDIRDSSLFKHY